MKCPYCGRPNSDRAHTCSHCGRRLDGAREKRRERRLLVYGIILVIVILVVGIGAMITVSRMMGGNEPPAQAEVTPTPSVVTPTPTATPTPEPVPTEEPEPEEVEEKEEVEEEGNSVTLVDDTRRAEVELMGYSPVVITAAEATSTIAQTGMDNSPSVLYDAQDWSSWQEGVAGDGVGESVTLTFDREYQIHFLTIRLGNWYAANDFAENNRPEKMTFELGDERFTATFPDERKEFCLELARDIPASQLRMTIDSTYKGSIYDDTCINEIAIYGI